jgi:hypothetical protein
MSLLANRMPLTKGELKIGQDSGHKSMAFPGSVNDSARFFFQLVKIRFAMFLTPLCRIIKSPETKKKWARPNCAGLWPSVKAKSMNSDIYVFSFSHQCYPWVNGQMRNGDHLNVNKIVSRLGQSLLWNDKKRFRRFFRPPVSWYRETCSSIGKESWCVPN